MDVESAVRQRYSEASHAVVPSLCCAVEYNRELLKAIPQEVIDRDYGCGDPSRHLQQGEVVLDLGSGTGKICFIAAQVVGRAGRVIGVDMNDDMLALARRYAPQVAQTIGFANTDFRKARIQDLALDLECFEAGLKENPICDASSFFAAAERAETMRRATPLVPSESVDVVVSNCVLNLVSAPAKEQLFGEIYRVTKPGGRAVISDIVSNQPVPQVMQDDPELWCGCISGALMELDFVNAFAKAGFPSVRVLKREKEPWRVVNGIEFRAITIEAQKSKPGGIPLAPLPCCETPASCC